MWVGVCPGHPALPYPCPTLFVTTDREIDRHHVCFYIQDVWPPCPALPLPCSTLFVTTDKQIDKQRPCLLLYIGCLATLPCPVLPLPYPVCHHRQTDRQTDTTMFAFIYRMEGFLLLKGDINLLLVNITQEGIQKIIQWLLLC